MFTRYTIAVGEGDDPVGISGDFLPVARGENGELLNITTVYELDMPMGTRFYVTLRGYNLAGLYSTARSEVVVVSPNPHITILDGYTGQDARLVLTALVSYDILHVYCVAQLLSQ